MISKELFFAVLSILGAGLASYFATLLANKRSYRYTQEQEKNKESAYYSYIARQAPDIIRNIKEQVLESNIRQFSLSSHHPADSNARIRQFAFSGTGVVDIKIQCKFLLEQKLLTIVFRTYPAVVNSGVVYEISEKLVDLVKKYS